jgi:hypothetical protein
MSYDRIAIIAKALCKSGKFETGEGTCAMLCMSQPGSARRSCDYRNEVHGKLAEQIDAAISKATGA